MSEKVLKCPRCNAVSPVSAGKCLNCGLPMVRKKKKKTAGNDASAQTAPTASPPEKPLVAKPPQAKIEIGMLSAFESTLHIESDVPPSSQSRPSGMPGIERIEKDESTLSESDCRSDLIEDHRMADQEVESQDDFLSQLVENEAEEAGKYFAEKGTDPTSSEFSFPKASTPPPQSRPPSRIESPSNSFVRPTTPSAKPKDYAAIRRRQNITRRLGHLLWQSILLCALILLGIPFAQSLLLQGQWTGQIVSEKGNRMDLTLALERSVNQVRGSAQFFFPDTTPSGKKSIASSFISVVIFDERGIVNGVFGRRDLVLRVHDPAGKPEKALVLSGRFLGRDRIGGTITHQYKELGTFSLQRSR